MPHAEETLSYLKTPKALRGLKTNPKALLRATTSSRKN